MSVVWRVGTSGWNYRHWKNIFYPSQIPVSKWLDHYASRFDTVELNATFYRLPKPETFDQWYRKTPKGFLWAVKASKYITHTKRLQDCKESLDRFHDRVTRLKEKLGPILVQLPPSLLFEKRRFDEFCKDLDPAHRYAVEVRHGSWVDVEFYRMMANQNIAYCISDTAGRYPYSEEITADFVYIRLHGSQKLYASLYSEEELQGWASKIRQWNRDTFVYFDNDFEGHAIRNAQRLKEILGL